MTIVSPATRNAILDAVAPNWGVTPAQIMSKRKPRPVAWARQDAMWRLRSIKASDGSPKHSLPCIAASLGLRNHTSVKEGVEAHEARLRMVLEAVA